MPPILRKLHTHSQFNPIVSYPQRHVNSVVVIHGGHHHTYPLLSSFAVFRVVDPPSSTHTRYHYHILGTLHHTHTFVKHPNVAQNVAFCFALKRIHNYRCSLTLHTNIVVLAFTSHTPSLTSLTLLWYNIYIIVRIYTHMMRNCVCYKGADISNFSFAYILLFMNIY